MSRLARQKLHFTKLRDFGAFQDDIALLDTNKVGAIDRSMVQERPNSSEHVLFSAHADAYHWPSLVPVHTAGDPQGDRKGQGTRLPTAPGRRHEHTEPPQGDRKGLLPTSSTAPAPTMTTILPASNGQSAGGKDDGEGRSGTGPSKKESIQLAIRVAFTLLLFLFLFKSVSWPTLLGILTHVDPGILLVAVTVGTVGTIVSAYQWRSLLHAEGIVLDLARLINLYAVGIAFSHFLPTSVGGDVVKAMYVGRESGNNAGSASAVVMSRITGFFGMLFVATSAMLFWHAYYSSDILVIFVLLSLLVGGMIGGTVLLVKLLPAIVRGKWVNSRVEQIIAPATRIGNALSKSARRPRSLCVSTLFGVLFHLVVSLNYYGFALALHMSVPLYFYFVAIPLVTLIAFLPISINGFGVRESTFVYIFSTIHIPASTSLLLAFLMDLEVLFFGAVGGCIYLTMGRKVNDCQGDREGRPYNDYE